MLEIFAECLRYLSECQTLVSKFQRYVSRADIFCYFRALAKSAGPIVRPMAPTTGEAHETLLLPHEHRHPTHSVLFRPGTGPYTVHHPDPPFRTCFRAFGREEYGVWALTAAVPAYLGYRNSSRPCRGRA